MGGKFGTRRGPVKEGRGTKCMNMNVIEMHYMPIHINNIYFVYYIFLGSKESVKIKLSFKNNKLTKKKNTKTKVTKQIVNLIMLLNRPNLSIHQGQLSIKYIRT